MFDRCARQAGRHDEAAAARDAPLVRALLLAGAADPAPEVSEPGLEWLNDAPAGDETGPRRLAGENLSCRLQALHRFAEAAAAEPPSAGDPTAAVTRRAMAAAEERWAAVAATLLMAVPEANTAAIGQALHNAGAGSRREAEQQRRRQQLAFRPSLVPLSCFVLRCLILAGRFFACFAIFLIPCLWFPPAPHSYTKMDINTQWEEASGAMEAPLFVSLPSSVAGTLAPESLGGLMMATLDDSQAADGGGGSSFAGSFVSATQAAAHASSRNRATAAVTAGGGFGGAQQGPFAAGRKRSLFGPAAGASQAAASQQLALMTPEQREAERRKHLSSLQARHACFCFAPPSPFNHSHGRVTLLTRLAMITAE